MNLFHSILLIISICIVVDQQFNNFYIVSAFDDTVIVQTTLGAVVGYKKGMVNYFLGIPFAEPPIGRNRFRPPRPKTPWYPSRLSAYNYSPECLQSTLFSSDDLDRPRSEDCLYLNIWQPSKKSTTLYPVMIWIYGGAFQHGGSTKLEYKGNKLAERGVIVVSFNYRIGALGFLVSISDGLFGNYGLDDQKTAIQWVQNNILSFGGDPNRVTLFGESAGAMSIGLHLLDQQSQIQNMKLKYPLKSYNKMFHAAIMQSNPLGYKYD
jgi:carboxylesterase type B